MPTVVDEKIHWGVMKFCYCTSHVEYIWAFLFGLPVLFGLWHPYNYCATIFWRLFYPAYVELANGKLTVGSTVLSFAKVIFIQRTFASPLVVGYNYKDVVLRHRSINEWKHLPSRTLPHCLS